MNTLFSYLFITLYLATQLNAQKTAFEVEIVGEGSPVLLFPGFTCTGDVWEDTVASLSKNYECHVFTFAGFGEVPPVSGDTPWLTQVKESIETYVTTKELEKPHIVGHSLGGSLALWLASENTEAYSKLIIVDALPAVGALMMPGVPSDRITYDNPYNEQLLNMDDDAFTTMATQMASGMTMTKEKVSQLTSWMQQSDRKTYVYGFTDLLKLDLRAQLAEIKNPVTILGAALPYGIETAKSTITNQYSTLEGYDLRMAESAAHFIMYDQPNWFDTQVKDVLNIQ